jgi:hypothetical protein
VIAGLATTMAAMTTTPPARTGEKWRRTVTRGNLVGAVEQDIVGEEQMDQPALPSHWTGPAPTTIGGTPEDPQEFGRNVPRKA